VIAALAAAMAPPMAPASARVAAAAIERLSASALGLRHAALWAPFAALKAPAPAPAAPESLVAAAPVGIEIALGSRAGNRGRFAQTQPALYPAEKSERLLDGSLKSPGRPGVIPRALRVASK